MKKLGDLRTREKKRSIRKNKSRGAEETNTSKKRERERKARKRNRNKKNIEETVRFENLSEKPNETDREKGSG